MPAVWIVPLEGELVRVEVRANGATLAELEQHLAYLRSLGAPDDAYPKVGVNEDYEVTMMICVVERPTAQASITS